MGVGWINNIFLLFMPGQYLVVVLSVIIPCRDSIQQWFTLCTDTVRSSHTVLTEILEDTLYSVYSPNFLSVEVTVVFNNIDVHKRHFALIER